jgi:hypothetical protein
MRHISKKRFLVVGGAVTTVAAGAALIAGATFGFFSSGGTASGTNTFTAGRVLVGLGAGTQVTCVVGPMSPGDTQATGVGHDGACEYDIVYTGNVNAFLGLDVAITGTAGTPVVAYPSGTPSAAQGVYDGSATGLQLDIHDATTTYMTGVQYNIAAGTATTLTPSGGAASVLGLLMNTTPVVNTNTRHLTVNYTLPTTANNAYDLATSSFVFTIHAVQADNNALPVACTTAGNQCSTALSGMVWS